MPIPQVIPDHFMILVTCRDEPHQRELLARLHADGLDRESLMAQPKACPGPARERMPGR